MERRRIIMTIHVQLFGVLAQRIGAGVVDVMLPPDANVAMLLVALAQEYEPIAAMRDRLAVAVNLEYAQAGDVLREGDEVAIIPPVSGG